MLRHHMTVLTKDNRLKREVQRITAATASTADFGSELSLLEGSKRPDLVIVDGRTGPPLIGLEGKVPPTCPIIHIVDEEQMLDALPRFAEGRVVSIMGYGARFDDDEFIASATKALRGNVFGLNKYFPWGVTTYSVVVNNYEQKSRAIDIIIQYANLAGIRAQVRERIQTVADELMMNALYHAPTDEKGNEKYAGRSFKDLAQLDNVAPIEVQYGSSGRYFGLSVRDGGGSLTRARAMRYLTKATTGTADIEEKIGGAGLGLVSVLRSVSKLVFNLDPGNSTEVIGLFDIELFAKGKVGARSLHLFTARGSTESEADVAPEAEVPPPPPEPLAEPVAAPTRRGVWLLAALLLAVVTAMGTAVVMKSGRDAPSAVDCPPASGTDHANTRPTP